MSHEKTFYWVQFPEGRAKFAGTQRGWDERGHKTFALELRGNEYFGEISRSYLDNQNDYNLTIDSFGYGRAEDVGMLAPEAREVFTHDEEITARSLVVQLIGAGLKFDDSPTVLDQTDTSRFMGKIFFNGGWMLVNADRGRHAMTDYFAQVEQVTKADSLEENRDIARKFSAKADGEGGVLYSRSVGGVNSEVIALELGRARDTP